MPADQRILLYGASNLWLSRKAALSEIRARFEGQLEIGLACGPGRSYGLDAGNPLNRYRALKSIDFELPTPQPNKCWALLTDVGNDIAYQQSPDTIIAWMGDLAAFLEKRGYKIRMTGLPAETLSTVPPWMFKLLAWLYYSKRDLQQSELNQALWDVEGGLQELCEKRGYPFIPTQPHWFGIDHFHLRPSCNREYWNTNLQHHPRLTEHKVRAKIPLVKGLEPQKYWLVGKEKVGREVYDSVVPDAKLWVR